MIQTLEWTESGVRFIDQTKLPTRKPTSMHDPRAGRGCIRNMVVRGAPALAWRRRWELPSGAELEGRDGQRNETGTRSNLRHHRQNSPDRGKSLLGYPPNAGQIESLRRRPLTEIKQALIEEASACTPKTLPPTRRWPPRRGAHAASGGVLTHCNAGALPLALRHGSRCYPSGRRARQEDSRLCHETRPSCKVHGLRRGTDEGRNPTTVISDNMPAP